MSREGFTAQHRVFGIISGWAIFVLGMVYAVTLLLGLLSLKSPQDPIGDPYFSILEVLIILMAPLMIMSMVSVHAYALPEAKAVGLTALVFITLLAGITTSNHFVILTVSRQLEASQPALFSALLSFKWPSVIYTLDILAWDFFFALSLLFAAPVFTQGRLETAVRILLIVSGVLSLAGLIGVPLADMQVRMVGVVGYAGVAPVAFLLMGLVFKRV